MQLLMQIFLKNYVFLQIYMQSLAIFLKKTRALPIFRPIVITFRSLVSRSVGQSVGPSTSVSQKLDGFLSNLRGFEELDLIESLEGGPPVPKRTKLQ